MDTTWKLTVEFDSKDDAEQLLQIIDDWTAGGLHSLWRSTYSGFDNPPYWPNELYLLVSGIEEVTSETSLVDRGMSVYLHKMRTIDLMERSARAEAEAEKYGVAMEIGIDMEGSND